MLRILIVDDSATARTALRRAFESQDDLRVVGEVETGAEALASVARERPDLITMDVHLHRENGLEVTERIMESVPTPILVVTGVNAEDPQLAFRAMAAGALDVLGKLPPPHSPRYAAERNRLVRTVRALATVPVVTRRRRTTQKTPPAKPETAAPEEPRRALLIGASTGGPPVLNGLLRALPVPLPVPVLVVQHIFQGFAEGLAAWVAGACSHKVVVCHHACELEDGTVYFAPSAATWSCSTSVTWARRRTPGAATSGHRSTSCSRAPPSTSADEPSRCCSPAWGRTAPLAWRRCAKRAR